MSEIWKTIDGYDNYQVSNIGRVRSDYTYGRWGVAMRKSPMILRQDLTKDGYLRVTICKGHTQKHFAVHRLVAMAFIPNPLNYPEINHKDENTQNNCVENLEWCTRKYNANFGTLRQRESEWNINHPSKSKPVIQMTVCGEILAIFPSAREAERQTGARNECIIRCCKGKQETSLGYKWKYKV